VASVIAGGAAGGAASARAPTRAPGKGPAQAGGKLNAPPGKGHKEWLKRKAKTGRRGAGGSSSGPGRTEEGQEKGAARTLLDAIAHVHASFNNTIITITDRQGNTLSWATSGGLRLSAARARARPFAAQVAAEKGRKLPRRSTAVKNVEVRGGRARTGTRNPRWRALNNCGLKITSISDVTPIPHNGCRPPEKRQGLGVNEGQ